MGRKNKNIILRFNLILFLLLSLSKNYTFASPSSSETSLSALMQGYSCYRARDWASTVLFLRKAMADKSLANPEAYYMLICSDVYAKDYSSAVLDCDYFIQNYADSPLLGNVEYQKGRALHFMGQNDSAVLMLSDFCHEYYESELYPSGLYWIAECFYDDYNYDTAQVIYQQVVDLYPSDSKAEEAQAKLDLIAQKNREKKLLYLLKVTGEEFLNSKESYERQLRLYQAEDVEEMHRQLEAALAKIQELEKSSYNSSDNSTYVPQYTQTAVNGQTSSDTQSEEDSSSDKKSGLGDEEIEILKTKAALLQQVLE